MVVSDFNIKRIALCKPKTNPELIVDPNTELPFPFSFQSLQTIARRNSKVVQCPRRVQ
jgi:hypothetical protein